MQERAKGARASQADPEDLAALKRYKKHFNLKNLSTNNKEDLQAAVIRHFAQQLRADSGKTERMFLKFLKQRDD